MHYNIYYLYI